VTFAAGFFAFIALAFALESAGLFAHELNLFLAILGLLVAASLSPRATTDRRLRHSLPGFFLILLGLALLCGPWKVRLFAAAVYFWGLHLLSGRRSALPAALALGTLTAGVFEWLWSTSVLAWYLVDGLSRTLSYTVGYCIEKIFEFAGRQGPPPPKLGPSFSGMSVVALACSFAIAGTIFDIRARKSPFRIFVDTGGWLILIAFVWLLYILVFTFTPWVVGYKAGEPQAGFAAGIYPLYMPLLLCLLLGATAAWRLLGVKLPEEKKQKTPLSAWVFPLASGVLSVWALTNVPASQPENTRRVAFYKKGFLNWLVPTHERYGRYSSGMFGNLPALIASMGWEAEIIPEITPDTLDGKHILVIINQDHVLPPESLAVIDRFVKEGGSLLILGDHTFWKEVKRVVLNDPIRNTHMEVRFDSADFFIGGWLHSYRLRPHFITVGLDDHTNEPGSVVGASLAIRYPAAPILIGRFGYSDPGSPEATDRGYLGNLDYDPGEELGDIVLAACENVRKGRVLVVGDTSSFTNAIAVRTWRYVVRVFSWLGRNGRACVPLWRELLGIGLAFFSLFCVYFLPGDLSNRTAVLSLVLLCAVHVSDYVLWDFAAPPPLRGKVAVVDFSHLGKFSLEGWNVNGVDGVFLNLMREGYLPVAMKRFDAEQLSAADIFVTIAPTARYTSEEQEVLADFLQKGGVLIAAVGWEDRKPIEPFLRRFGIMIEGKPLGRGQGTARSIPDRPYIFEGWPVKGGEVLLYYFDEPVAVRKPVGKGTLIVIGDSGFLLNKNLEVKEGGVLPNVRFFSHLLREAAKR